MGTYKYHVIPVKVPHTSDDHPITVHITCEWAEEWGTLITESHTNSNFLLLNLDFPTRLLSRRNPNSPDLIVASSQKAIDSEWHTLTTLNYDHLPLRPCWKSGYYPLSSSVSAIWSDSLYTIRPDIR